MKSLETSCLSREQQRVKQNLSQVYSDIVYDGRWFTQLRSNIDTFMEDVSSYTTGEIKLRLFKTSAIVIGIKSDYSLYDFKLATYSSEDSFDHTAATGFIDIYSLPARIQARKQTFRDTK